ncbi:MAG TPA: potassium-transporting ATPase subunit C [Conexibacter sp.]|jgi:K+-transporting ATPase ATPase C chain|nr:potassium-transporting ATPase subunit C [Conexibacter sp.]
MRRDLTTSLLAVVVFTVLLGLLYPFAVWGIGQVAFPGKADGSQIRMHGKLIGSTLIGQDFSRPVLDRHGKPKQDAKGKPVTEPDPKWFQERPSADAYNPAGTFFANRGPNQASTVAFYKGGLAAYIALERPYDRGLTAAQVPVDAVTASASGVDPHISKANALIQAHRIAAVRHLPLDRVHQLIDDHTDGRFAGLLGEPGVNVVELNIALDKEAPAK